MRPCGRSATATGRFRAYGRPVATPRFSRRMRHRLTRTLRRWAAALLAAAYVFGVVAPAAAFAHADRDAIAHVLSESHGGTLTLHFHPGGKHHEDSGKSGHQCCGVSALAALVPPADPGVVQPVARQGHIALATRSLEGLAASRLDRPPR